MRISVITPSYNQASYLQETIESVLSQSYPDLEYILVEGGSQDDSRAVAEGYLDRGVILIDAPGTNQAEAINIGLERATGEIRTWLNSDDIHFPGVLHQVARRFQEQPELDVLYGFEHSIDARGDVLGLRRAPEKITQASARWLGISLPQPTVYWRRRVQEQVGLLDRSYEFALDNEYWYRMAAANCRFARLPRVLAATRHHDQAKTGMQTGRLGLGSNRGRILDESYRAFRSHGGKRWSPLHFRNLLRRRIRNRWLLEPLDRMIRLYARCTGRT